MRHECAAVFFWCEGLGARSRGFGGGGEEDVTLDVFRVDGL